MITIAVNPLATTFFIAIRLGTLILFSPIEAIRLLPIHIRLLLVFMLSLLMVTQLTTFAQSNDNLSLLLGGISEFCNGLILSLSLYAAFGVFQIAGQLMDTQMGFNSLAIFNPAEHTPDPLSGRLLVMLAVLFFFAIDGHQKLFQGLSLSFKIIPPGHLVIFEGFKPIIHQISMMFSFAVMIASPIIASLMVIDISGSVLTRNMPQINIYFLTLPVKILLGLLMLSLLLTLINPIINTVFQACFQSWNEIVS